MLVAPVLTCPPVAGFQLSTEAHFDNSIANTFNPDPNTTIYRGDQHWDEMQNGFVGVLIDPTIDEASLSPPSGPSPLPPGAAGPTLSTLK
jgi:hypothetical protein